MANFPTKATGLSQGESPSLYSNEAMVDDDTVSAKTEGGYEYRRNRFSRAPRRAIETGFINLPHVDYLTIKAFFDTHLKTTEFIWYDQILEQNFTVRFDDFKADYKGIGQNRMWNIKIKMSTP